MLKLTYPAIETLKEGARLVLFAVVAAALTALGDWAGAMDQNEIWVIGITYVLRLADKYVHKTEAIDKNGIAPF